MARFHGTEDGVAHTYKCMHACAQLQRQWWLNGDGPHYAHMFWYLVPFWEGLGGVELSLGVGYVQSL